MASQFKDGDIIAYKPNLDYGKDVKTKLDDRFYQEGQPVEYTPAVIAFTRTKASDVLSSLKSTIDKITDYMGAVGSDLREDIREAITFPAFASALKSQNKEIIVKYLNSHSVDIKGKTGVEVYKYLSDAVNELNQMKGIYSKVVYGDSEIALDTAQERDNAYNNNLIEYENKKEYSKINYAALSIDTLFNKTIGGYSQMMDAYADNLYGLHVSKAFVEPINKQPSIDKTVNTMFKQSLTLNDNDNKKLATYTNRNLLPAIMKDIVLKRKDYLDLLNAKETLNKTSFVNPDIINRNITQIQESISNSIVDFNKSIISISMYRDDICSSLGEKDYFRNIYSSLL